ncbi:Bromodomain containing protein [Trichomonas vaginalis G3]|uniref:Bromodomain containing protein n=1 Tax=Trichomonas vaginalis (strain ATCC PRA-98 / G3) TaxID=412133 RepID=A2DK09_TRIV3|nr:acetylation-dependent protein binding [Trichomonas vaginalis G3]EAY19180.1 Bromodomain containing protein [Trichomonas vaginalis G3]KAI5548464.1 acetylation-dependent protein binding [Trichomonas vaginalis G3]|eukprot:XP_001580166.1 Bromodomain containing protein [Trichomonas vaginalis G3]
MLPFPVDHAVKIMNRLSEKQTSILFSRPVDPQEDDCPDYYKKIKKPMDLGTVRQKIDSGRYKTVHEWRADMELIFSNSLKYNVHSPYLIAITKDLRERFRELSNELSDFPETDWFTRLNRLETELHELIQNPPDNYTARVRHTKLQAPLTDDQKSRRKVRPPTNDEIQRLTRDIHNINNEAQLRQIYKILVDNENSVSDKKDNIDVNMNGLHAQTYYELRYKVDAFLENCK